MKEGKPGKKRTLIWIWIILLIASFAGGCVVGLKLSTMPLPPVIRDRLLEKMGTALPSLGEPDAEPEATAEPDPFADAAETEAPAAAEQTLAPAELPAPEETAEPAEKPAEAEKPAANAAPAAYISLDDAVDKALALAKVDKADAEITGASREKESDGKLVYLISFDAGERSYAYTLDAATGELEGFKVSEPSAAEEQAPSAEETPVPEQK